MKVVGVIQARTGSERLPNKVLTDLAGRPIVEWLFLRATSVAALDEIVVAVPEGDRPLIEWASAGGVPLIEGPEDDVLARFCQAARLSGADAVVRMTADCPLLDPKLVEDVIQRYAALPGCDYYFVDGYPRGCGDAEVISTSALMRSEAEATVPAEREHVVTHAINRPHDFWIELAEAPASRNRPSLRVCVDEPADLLAVRAIVAELGIDATSPTVGQVIDFLDHHPDVVALNSGVQQKGL